MNEPLRRCVGCGYCCQQAPCALGYVLHGLGRPCPSLVEQDGRFWCRQVLEARGAARDRIVKDLSIGGGCGSSLNTMRLRQLRKAAGRLNKL